MNQSNRRKLHLQCLDEFAAFLAGSKRKGTLAKNLFIACHGGSKKGRHETYSANIENFTLQFYLPNHRLPNQQGIQGTIMFRYRLCDRQHFWRLSMGSKMPYSMLHNLHSNQTNRFEILHFLLNYKS